MGHPDVTRGNGRGASSCALYYWADLQSVHGFRCYDNTHVCKLIALQNTENAYSAERELSASACTRSMAAFVIEMRKPCLAKLLPISVVGTSLGLCRQPCPRRPFPIFIHGQK